MAARKSRAEWNASIIELSQQVDRELEALRRESQDLSRLLDDNIG
ncbi:hypothetical protein SAMN05444695_11867 [Rhodococcus triatomae]|uniref:Uncharacterized protein n=1 Tax=Rhodococcus triatomae TaxID=300028 RepID=A0A1G8RQ40_9NOCA|nr:hypothetical protein [Rhodococcus triatomae]SDJ19023.1 hypothetical protein SAMN05444695_11867 [Rhodococcus triatomae]